MITKVQIRLQKKEQEGEKRITATFYVEEGAVYKSCGSLDLPVNVSILGALLYGAGMLDGRLDLDMLPLDDQGEPTTFD